MNYTELLTKVRGKDWRPPSTLVAIDPGETTGFAVFFDGLPSSVYQIKVDVSSGALGWDPLIDKIGKYKPNVLVYEEYKIYPNKLKVHNFSDIPTLKIIGAIEFVCAHNDYKTIKQMASTAKGFCTNDKLKDWGFYRKGKPHGMDALRHGLHALLFSKEL